jgi:hypothetical protein
MRQRREANSVEQGRWLRRAAHGYVHSGGKERWRLIRRRATDAPSARHPPALSSFVSQESTSERSHPMLRP